MVEVHYLNFRFSVMLIYYSLKVATVEHVLEDAESVCVHFASGINTSAIKHKNT